MKIDYVLLALAVSFLITYPVGSVHQNNEDDWDWDGIENTEPVVGSLGHRTKDICPIDNFHFDTMIDWRARLLLPGDITSDWQPVLALKYHETCLIWAGLHTPRDADFEDDREAFAESFEDIVGITLTIQWDSLDETFMELNIQTCYDDDVGLQGYLWDMQTKAFEHEVQALLGTNSDFGARVELFLREHLVSRTDEEIKQLLNALSSAISGLHRAHANIYFGYAESAVSVGDLMCNSD